MSRNSPMMEQYRKIKEQHPDKLLMFQVGDFYELFYKDAEIASRELDLVLTSRDGGSENPVPLAGVPIHAAETYLNKLLNKGFKVVICDQIESAAQAKGIVRRAITRILTPGTISESEMLDEGSNNYLAVIVSDSSGNFGLAFLDVSTGEFSVTEQRESSAWSELSEELIRLKPSELLCSNRQVEELCLKLKASLNNVIVASLPLVPDLEEARQVIAANYNVSILENLQPDQFPLATIAAAASLTYLEELKQLPRKIRHFKNPELYFIKGYLILDNITSKNLELTESISGGKRGCLLEIIDHCLTGMGRRLLKRRLELPLIDRNMVEKRLDAVEELCNKPLIRREIRHQLSKVFDLERFCSKLAYRKVYPRDLPALKRAVAYCKPLIKLLKPIESVELRSLADMMPDFEELIILIERSLKDDPPATLKDGEIFRENYNLEVDQLRSLVREGSTMLLDYEKEERSRTGIKSLRVGYNRNFGYYLEVTKTNIDLIPQYYQRKQTLVGAERYTTDQLFELENKLTGAREKLIALEQRLFEELLDQIGAWIVRLQKAADLIAEFDFFQGLAETAERYGYCRPRFSKNGSLKITQNRHPVVEQLTSEKFVPNNVLVDRDNFILLLTGPNMAGKSTYIRSVALAAVLAQTGSFIPAETAELPLFDRIFARVGASDDLSKGHSTFMVEMTETATILKESTENSLIILDEIGRGTSTYDGMSIARSVLEYISKHIGAKTLFSTHYHELTGLEGEISGVKNYSMAVKEKGNEVIFLRQVVPGKADKSYGINVARLAGLPVEVLIRAETILVEHEQAASTAAEQQLSLLPIIVNQSRDDHNSVFEAVNKIKTLDLNRMTPLEAMKALFDLQQELFTGEDE